ncbi:hypothetical protein [Streptomyces sp. CC224E]|uniref:hypothetical protein n=1 Tax=unclassified Streptomyces TaxID=2593676 RepID=UPI0035576DC2
MTETERAEIERAEIERAETEQAEIERAEADGVDKGIATPPTPPTAAPARTELVPADERAALEKRLRHALTGFVDEPRAAVEEADHVLEDLAARLTETLAGHRRTLRTSWQDPTEGPEDTERLRLALRDYRETAERLLRI